MAYLGVLTSFCPGREIVIIPMQKTSDPCRNMLCNLFVHWKQKLAAQNLDITNKLFRLIYNDKVNSFKFSFLKPESYWVQFVSS